MQDPAILILAGRRSDLPDALAAVSGVSHKCLVPIAGQAMISRVIATAANAFPDAKLFVSIEDFSILKGEAVIARFVAAGRLIPVPAEQQIVDSILNGIEAAGFPLIITTADNVLLSVDALQALADEGAKANADAVVALARREDVVAAHADGQRRFYEFSDTAISNCNLYWLGNAQAVRAAETFRGGGQFAKHPGRIVKAFGLVNLIRFRFRLATLEQSFANISRRFKVRVKPMLVSDGRLAIDVDNDRTRGIVEEIFAREAAA
ncbi:MAG: NTP transferase domain-containing protein [Sphingosinicella sp.]|nr:NTP transferase domain-containing protein [Sphingosinicella sp.]